MKIADEDAISQGVDEFWLDASLNAVPFYKALGWTHVEQTMHGPLPCVRMTKRLSRSHKQQALNDAEGNDN